MIATIIALTIAERPSFMQPLWWCCNNDYCYSCSYHCPDLLLQSCIL